MPLFAPAASRVDTTRTVLGRGGSSVLGSDPKGFFGAWLPAQQSAMQVLIGGFFSPINSTRREKDGGDLSARTSGTRLTFMQRLDLSARFDVIAPLIVVYLWISLSAKALSVHATQTWRVFFFRSVTRRCVHKPTVERTGTPRWSWAPSNGGPRGGRDMPTETDVNGVSDRPAYLPTGWRELHATEARAHAHSKPTHLPL
ncbi:hypothetical protein BBP40_011473 [Aspergillus hancockii]|nr:hypothetical protein BBP40_011473 [Aspergillus hancockii]